ncbi:MAG: hydrogenase nickel incorporation protein HypB [Syntrophomonadaceae bacterium]|nr:hydrogenase nickel incorporation protein HypB [Syntrophomonadaceae bacterium]
MKVELVTNVLDANTAIAEQNRQFFAAKGVFVLNLMSAPGAGKTTILEKTIEALKDQIRIGVIEGDICTTRDAERIAALGIPAVQINTDGACHLDANMILRSLQNLSLEDLDLLVIENVGNLVCPAEFDLGEHYKAMVISVTEGNDKPTKYPLMFKESQAILVNKLDLLPYTDFSLEVLKQDLETLNPQAQVFPISARTGEGVVAWSQWLVELASSIKSK